MQRMLKVLLISIFIIGNLCDSCGETMTASSIEDCKGLTLSSDEENLTTDTCWYYTINYLEILLDFVMEVLKDKNLLLNLKLKNISMNKVQMLLLILIVTHLIFNLVLLFLF